MCPPKRYQRAAQEGKICQREWVEGWKYHWDVQIGVVRKRGRNRVPNMQPLRYMSVRMRR